MSGDNIFERLVRRIDSKLVFFLDNLKYVSVLSIIFLLGFSVGVFAKLQNMEVQNNPQGNIQNAITLPPYNPNSDIPSSPVDRIKEDQIHVYNDKIIIDLKNAEWATFTPTHSMAPTFDSGANAIEIVPTSAEEINVGDIISYNSEYSTGTIIHRVVEIGNDENGWYCKVKGDNNPDVDPGKIRFSQIQRLVVAVIY